MTYVDEIVDYKKGKSKVYLADGTLWILYKGEIRRYQLKVGSLITEGLYEEIQTEVITKRAIKRAMHLLEKMDRTEAGLRDKLKMNEYPPESIEAAITYVKSYRYLDDERYAMNYVRCYQASRSRKRIQMDLCAKGVNKSVIEQALDTEYEGEERQLIRQLLEKKGYNRDLSDIKEQRKLYAFFMRKGFRSEDILSVMKCSDYLT